MNEKKPKRVFQQGPITGTYIGESIAAHARKKEIGAHSIFLGQVRNDVKEEGQVMAIEYTAYEEMANQQFHEIREAMFAKYNLTCLHIYHSLGRVNAGEISLFIFTSSPHRQAAIEACAEIVERVKKEVPVWGREILENESYLWKENL